MFYSVANADEYIAVTGMGIDDVDIRKSGFKLPFRKRERVSLRPEEYTVDLLGMTTEKLELEIQMVYTIGPDSTNEESLKKHAKLVAQPIYGKSHKSEEHVESIVKGIIEGETRVLVSSMTMEEIFKGREKFKTDVYRNIQNELDQFGLKIYNSNIKELKDAEGSEYFASLARKAHEGASNQARIDVADAQRKGTVGEAQQRGNQEADIARINAETAIRKNEKEIERKVAETRLKKEEVKLNFEAENERINANRELEAREEDLKKNIEIKRAAAELERQRARDVVAATIARESNQQSADAAAYEIETQSKANRVAEQNGADVSAYRVRLAAEAEKFAAEQMAEARLCEQVKRAEGISIMAEAYAKLAPVLGGPSGLLQYIMIENGGYIDLAKANAEGIRGLQPKISVWNTGNNSEGSGDATTAVRNMYQMLPPLTTTIHEQTGISLPEWQFGKIDTAKQVVDKSMVNGHSDKH